MPATRAISHSRATTVVSECQVTMLSQPYMISPSRFPPDAAAISF
jgi:hypothetical protein